MSSLVFSTIPQSFSAGLLSIHSSPSFEPTAPISLVSSANLLKVHSIPLYMSLMKILNSIYAYTYLKGGCKEDRDRLVSVFPMTGQGAKGTN
ncbi:hypothetical protein QYF61_008569 [Mycteria americana]|uniref:Uncharacterized protein n=1 Tax=Mycteria americana TaxID=33587 RepID=A0AAN7NR78_MYCAM|nr:hypothetical protein QYF61_008569 [Mycteria americana]